MKKSYLTISLLALLLLMGFVTISASLGSFKSLFSAVANLGTSYNLTLSSQKISNRDSSYNEEISSFVYTSDHNQIEFKCSNVINNNSGWQSILPNGYFYNPLNNNQNHNKISGISSIRFNSNESNNLSLCYGYTLDDENIIYSYEKDLVANITYELGDLNPSYIYIKNNNDFTVNITNLNIGYSCVDNTYPKQNLNVLMIGNSFADDTLFYSERVATSYGINLHLYDAYIPGCTINTHYSNITNNTAAYSMRNMNDSQWDYHDNMTLTEIINSHTWDIITFQQASAEVGRSNSFTNLSNLTNEVRTLVGSNPKFYWYQTWAYDKEYHDPGDAFSYFNNDQMTMFDSICECYRSQVEPLGIFEKLIPAGTAVQNLRSSYMKDTISRDLKHMSSVHGRYLLALNFISEVYDIDFEKSPCGYLPPEVDPTYKTVAYESIKNAEKNPLICTNSIYSVRELAGYNLANYTEIDVELVGCSYWNSTDSSNYNKRIANASGSSIKYATTKRFTSSTLPVGSLVVIDDAFGVRPESWTSDAVQASRKDETYANVIEVNSAFWSGYQYRAFNIFKAGKPDLIGQFSQIFDGFHIYVPNTSMGSLTPKSVNPSYSSDKQLFQNNLYNIDAFERVHLDPITGFYKCDSYYELTNSYVDDTAKKFVCTRPFYKSNGDLPENTVIIVDSGYQWRSDCWGQSGIYSPRPSNVTTQFSVLDVSFMNNFRRRTFNVSSTSSAYVNQNHRAFMDHLRIYVPTNSDIKLKVPNGTYKGIANVQSNQFSIVISIGKSSNNVAVALSNNDAGVTSYTYNSSTKVITIVTSGSFNYLSFTFKYGTITGTYDETNDRITGISCSGSIKDYVSNNGSIVVTKPTTSSTTYFNNCEGTTSELQSQFKRRYMSGSWQVDTGNSDRITSNNAQSISGASSLKLRGYSGGAVALNLNSDFSTAKSLENIQFWVYNSSNSDITIRMWGYKAKNFGSNFETGSVTAKKNQWTYCAMGFTKASIYNFQIADFTNSGVFLSFDDIYLFS